MTEFTITEAFRLETPNRKLVVKVGHETATGKFLDATFHDPDRDAMVTVPAEGLHMVFEAINDRMEF